MSEQFDPKELEKALQQNSREELVLTPEQREELKGLKADIERHFPGNWKIETEHDNTNEPGEESEEKAA